MRTRLDPDGLRRALTLRGLTQAELAALAGVTAATLSHAATGKMIDHTTIRKLARALTITPILPGAENLVVATAGAGGRPDTRSDSEGTQNAVPAAS